MDYLSNKDTFGYQSYELERRHLLQCCQLTYRKRFGRTETGERYSIVNCKECEELLLLSFIKATLSRAIGTQLHIEEPFRDHPNQLCWLNVWTHSFCFYYWKDTFSELNWSKVESTFYFFIRFLKSLYWWLCFPGFRFCSKIVVLYCRG